MYEKITKIRKANATYLAVEARYGGIFTYLSTPRRSQTFPCLNHSIIAQEIRIWRSGMRPQAHLNTIPPRRLCLWKGSSCEYLFVEVSCGGIATYQLMQGRSQTFSWLNHDIIAEHKLLAEFGQQVGMRPAVIGQDNT